MAGCRAGDCIYVHAHAAVCINSCVFVIGFESEGFYCFVPHAVEKHTSFGDDGSTTSHRYMYEKSVLHVIQM